MKTMPATAQVGSETKPQALELIADALEAQARALRALAAQTAEVDVQMMAVKDVADRWGIGLTSVYRLVNRKRLKALRFAGSTRIPLTEVLRYERRAAV